jgi:hypothetical protein
MANAIDGLKVSAALYFGTIAALVVGGYVWSIANEFTWIQALLSLPLVIMVLLLLLFLTLVFFVVDDDTPLPLFYRSQGRPPSWPASIHRWTTLGVYGP